MLRYVVCCKRYVWTDYIYHLLLDCSEPLSFFSTIANTIAHLTSIHKALNPQVRALSIKILESWKKDATNSFIYNQ